MNLNEKRLSKYVRSFLANISDRKPLRLVLKVAGSLIAVLLLFSKIDVTAALRTIGNIPPIYLFSALVIFNISQWISALRLNRFFHAIQVQLSEKMNLKLYYIGMFYNLLVPGGIGGDGFKAYLLHKKQHASLRQLASAMIADRLSGLIVILIFLILLLLLPGQANYPAVYPWIVGVALSASLIIFYASFRNFRNTIAHGLFLSLLVQGAQLTVIYLLLPAETAHQVPEYLIVFLVSSIATVIPVTIGGLGLRELVFLYGSSVFGLNAEIAVGTSFAFFLITVVSALPGIVLHNMLKENQLKRPAEAETLARLK